jgi:hypothetical protein
VTHSLGLVFLRLLTIIIIIINFQTSSNNWITLELQGISHYKNIDIQTILYLQVKIGKLDKNYHNKLKFTYYYKHETQQEWNCSKNVQFYT